MCLCLFVCGALGATIVVVAECSSPVCSLYRPYTDHTDQPLWTMHACNICNGIDVCLQHHVKRHGHEASFATPRTRTIKSYKHTHHKKSCRPHMRFVHSTVAALSVWMLYCGYCCCHIKTIASSGIERITCCLVGWSCV